MRRGIIYISTIIIACVIALQPVYGQLKSANIEIAKQAYESNDYITAAKIYKELIDSGYVSTNLYFNAGNSFYMLNNYPRAILYYEKMLKLDPTNEECNNNLELARSKIRKSGEEMPEFILNSKWSRFTSLLYPNQWAILHIAFFILALISNALFLILRKPKRKIWMRNIMIASLLLSALFFFSGNNRQKSIESSMEAIVFMDKIELKSSPDIGSLNLKMIYEGNKIKVLDHQEGWIEIETADGTKGWIDESIIEYI